MIIATTVHTTGVNWDGILVNAGFIGVIVAAVGRLVVNSINRTIEDKLRNIVDAALDKDVIPRLNELNQATAKHAISIARLEGIQTGKRLAIDEAGMASS